MPEEKNRSGLLQEYLAVSVSPDEALALIGKAFPAGVRADFTVPVWRGGYRHELPDGRIIQLGTYQDDYGMTMFILCESMDQTTNAVVTVLPIGCPDEQRIRARVANALHDYLLDGEFLDFDGSRDIPYPGFLTQC